MRPEIFATANVYRVWEALHGIAFGPFQSDQALASATVLSQHWPTAGASGFAVGLALGAGARAVQATSPTDAAESTSRLAIVQVSDIGCDSFRAPVGEATELG
jgi:hypothetical protein